LPIYWFLREAPGAIQFVFLTAFIVLAILCSNRAARDLLSVDPQIIVIDEVAGGLAALILSDSGDLFIQCAALAVFRILDIFKPWPVSVSIDPRIPGFEIVYDDVAAGVGAGLMIWIAMGLLH
jgi:phosphatidylglycerophosphatase A